MGDQGLRTARTMAEDRLVEEAKLRSDRESEALAAKIRARKAREADITDEELDEAFREHYERTGMGEHPDIEAVKRAAAASGGRPAYGQGEYCAPMLLARACALCWAAKDDGECLYALPAPAAPTAPLEPSDGEAAPSPEDRPETHDSGSVALTGDDHTGAGPRDGFWAHVALDGGPWSHQQLQGHPETYTAAWLLAGGHGQAIDATWDGAGSMSPKPGVAEAAELAEASKRYTACTPAEARIIEAVEGLLLVAEKQLVEQRSLGYKIDALARIIARRLP